MIGSEKKFFNNVDKQILTFPSPDKYDVNENRSKRGSPKIIIGTGKREEGGIGPNRNTKNNPGP